MPNSFIDLARSFAPVLLRMPLLGTVKPYDLEGGKLDEFERLTTANVGSAGPHWGLDKRGFGLGQDVALSANGGSIQVADGEELRLPRAATLWFAARKFQALAAEVGARVMAKEDAGGRCWDLSIGAANRLDLADGTNTRTMTAAALSGARTIGIRWSTGGTPQLFTDGAYQVDATGAVVPTDNDAPVYLGNSYLGTQGSFANEYGCWAIFPALLTPENLRDLHAAWVRITSIRARSRGIWQVRPASELSATAPALHLAGKATSARLVPDRSGNGRSGTATGSVVQSSGPEGAYQDSPGVGDPLIATAAAAALAPNELTLALRYLARSRGQSDQGCLWSVSDSGTTRSRLYLGAANTWWYEVAYASSTARWTFSAGLYNVVHKLVLTHDRDAGSVPVVKLDGAAVAVTEAVAPSGALTVTAAPIVNLFNTAAKDSDFNGRLYDCKMYGAVLSAADVATLYSVDALRAELLSERQQYPESLAAVAAAGHVGPWTWLSGSLTWTDSRDGRRLLGGATSQAWAPCDHAFGGWYFRGFKATDAGVLYMPIFTQKSASVTDSAQDGYVLTFGADESLTLQKITDGVLSNVFIAATAGSLRYGVEYEFFVTRSRDTSLFTVWVRGGSYITWTSLGTPTADTTHTTASYRTVQVDAGGYVSDVTDYPEGDGLVATSLPATEPSNRRLVVAIKGNTVAASIRYTAELCVPLDDSGRWWSKDLWTTRENSGAGGAIRITKRTLAQLCDANRYAITHDDAARSVGNWYDAPSGDIVSIANAVYCLGTASEWVRYTAVAANAGAKLVWQHAVTSVSGTAYVVVRDSGGNEIAASYYNIATDGTNRYVVCLDASTSNRIVDTLIASGLPADTYTITITAAGTGATKRIYDIAFYAVDTTVVGDPFGTDIFLDETDPSVVMGVSGNIEYATFVAAPGDTPDDVWGTHDKSTNMAGFALFQNDMNDVATDITTAFGLAATMQGTRYYARSFSASFQNTCTVETVAVVDIDCDICFDRDGYRADVLRTAKCDIDIDLEYWAMNMCPRKSSGGADVLKCSGEVYNLGRAVSPDTISYLPVVGNHGSEIVGDGWMTAVDVKYPRVFEGIIVDAVQATVLALVTDRGLDDTIKDYRNSVLTNVAGYVRQLSGAKFFCSARWTTALF